MKAPYWLGMVAISGILAILGACDLVDSMLNPDHPLITSVSAGDYADQISVAWKAPNLANDPDLSVDHYTVLWSLDGASTVSDKLSNTSFDIKNVQVARLYSVLVRVHLMSAATGTISETRDSAAVDGFAMNATLLRFGAAPTVLPLSGATEYWFETMLQKGFSYTWSGLPNGATLSIFPKGTIQESAVVWNTFNWPDLWLCDNSGTVGKFYIRIDGLVGPANLSCNFTSR